MNIDLAKKLVLAVLAAVLVAPALGATEPAPSSADEPTVTLHYRPAVSAYPSWGVWGRYGWGRGRAVVVSAATPFGSRAGMGALDLNVRPRKAQVYVDGDLIGTADDFDGFPSYLWLDQGTYDVVLYLPGYQTLSRQISVYDGVVQRINDHLSPGEAVRPEDLPVQSTVNRDERLRRDRERQMDAARQQAYEERSDAIGRLFFAISPPDAAVYLDGHFLGTADELYALRAGMIVQPGEHVLEVVHPDFRATRENVVVPAGERVELDIRLEPK